MEAKRTWVESKRMTQKMRGARMVASSALSVVDHTLRGTARASSRVRWTPTPTTLHVLRTARSRSVHRLMASHPEASTMRTVLISTNRRRFAIRCGNERSAFLCRAPTGSLDGAELQHAGPSRDAGDHARRERTMLRHATRFIIETLEQDPDVAIYREWTFRCAGWGQHHSRHVLPGARLVAFKRLLDCQPVLLQDLGSGHH